MKLNLKKPYFLLSDIEKAEYDAYKNEALKLASERGKRKARREFKK